MIADAWRRRDFVAAGFALAGIVLLCLGLLIDSSGLLVAGGVVINLSWVVLIIWRVTRGPDRRV